LPRGGSGPVVAGRISEWIGLPDQAGKLGQRIATASFIARSARRAARRII
jgi:hypothetical protein